MLLHLMDLLQLCKPICQPSYVFWIVLAAHLIPNIPCLHSIPKVLHVYIIFLDCPLTHKLRHPSQQHTELQEQELTGLTVAISYLMRDTLLQILSTLDSNECIDDPYIITTAVHHQTLDNRMKEPATK